MRTFSRKGFTLVEMIVVVLILGIFVTLGAFSARAIFSKAYDADAQARLDRLVTAQMLVSNDFGQYSPYARDVLKAGSDFVVADAGSSSVSGSNGRPVVSMAVSVLGDFGAATFADGQCLFVFLPVDSTSADVVRGTLPVPSGQCTGLAALQSQDPAATAKPASTQSGSLLTEN